MSARERLTEALRNPGLVGFDEDGADELIDAFAHELAEEIRAVADEEFPDGESNPQEFYGDWGSFYRDAADVIDPEVDESDDKRPVSSEEKNA